MTTVYRLVKYYGLNTTLLVLRDLFFKIERNMCQLTRRIGVIFCIDWS